MDEDQEAALITVVCNDAEPTIEIVARELGVEAEAFDSSFGLVPVDPSRRLFAAKIRADRLPAAAASDDSYSGPFSDPLIESVGPPRTSRPSDDE